MKNWVTLLILISIGCNDDNREIINESDEFQICNSSLVSCNNLRSEYCLWGYKWGEGNPYSEDFYIGANERGPKLSGGTVTYSLQSENGFVDTHRQINIPSESTEKLIHCGELEIDNAFGRWSSIANVDFEKQAVNSASDIKIYVANIDQGGVGYPNFDIEKCQALKGTIIIRATLGIENCEDFRALILHEIGHVLGLGHVGSQNIMQSNIVNKGIFDVQYGDSLGIVQIYGARN